MFWKVFGMWEENVCRVTMSVIQFLSGKFVKVSVIGSVQVLRHHVFKYLDPPPVTVLPVRTTLAYLFMPGFIF